MAFPGRPTIVPGIPLPSPMGMGAYMPPMIPSVMAMPSMMPVRPYRPRNNHQKMFSEPPRKGAPESGPTITVFIGNIVEHAPDLMIKHVLATCGQVISWKRVQGFGFCEFGSPASALRAIRVLHDKAIGAKKLVVKVDANTTVKLNEYKRAQRKKQGKPDVPEGPNQEMDLEDYTDEHTRQADHRCSSTIYQILKEFHEEMENAFQEKKEELQFTKEIIQNLPDPKRAQKSQDILTKLARDTNEKGVGKDDLEDGKRELITKEISKFREIMKKQEAEREEERLRREQKQQEKDKGRSRSRSRSMSTVRSARSARSPRSPSMSKASTPEPRHRSRRPRSHSRSRERERERERDRDREREREREVRERERDTPKSRQAKRDLDRAAARELEEEEEAKERKKLEKKTREKEVAYQERVRMWESRERRKRKDFDKEKDKKMQKEEAMAREAKKLKEFLEDYDDERDDAKYYKGRELQRLTLERDKERESDNKDRMREREEIEELRNKVLESETADPTGVYEQLLQEHENLYKPKIIIDVNAEQMVRQREREKERERERETEMRALEEEKKRKEAELLALGSSKKSNDASPSDDDDDRGADFGPGSYNNSPSDNDEPSAVSATAAVGGKKKKLDLKDVFNADEDEDSAQGPKRRKLVPLDYDEKDKSASKDRKKKDHHKKDDKKGDENSKSTEEKRKHVKSLIDKIPTDKGALFEYTIDWTMVDNILMEKRIRPWINKKIIEYIGEPEPTLVDFICSKVLAGSQPQGILDDVQMVLDEEAEIFVVKMWRLLIYEIEAKKMGIVK